MVRIPHAEIPADAPIHNNLVRATLNNPDMHRGFASLAGRVHSTSHLSQRLRELVVLRTVANLGAEYEWANHVVGARSIGITDDEIRHLREGRLDSFSPSERCAIDFALAVEDRAVGEATWQQAREHFSPVELLDLVLLVGFYGMASRLVMALGVELDKGLQGLAHP